MAKIRKAPASARTEVRSTRARASLTKANYEALSDFRFALRRFLAFSEGAAKQAGLTPQQHQALLTIKGAQDADSVSIRLLAERLLINHNTAVELVDRLVAAGLVERSRDAEDRRRARLELTGDAERRLQSLSAAHLKELQTVRPALLKLLKQLD
jgi:DNA-binding MarR family transcriptional regulator